MQDKNHNSSFFQRYIPLMVIAALTAFITVTSLYFMFNHHKAQKTIVDSAKTEMKKLPPEVKKQIAIATSSATFRVPILLYHYVEYVKDKRDTKRQALNINPYVFEQEVKTLTDAGYTFITAKELGNVIDGKMQLPQKPVILTFDDGHWDLYTSVLPILKKYNIKATAYIVPGFIGGSDSLTKDQVQGVVDSGLIDVGAHTVHHVSLKNMLLSSVKREIENSKAMLENTYHVRVVSFAYPNGSFDLQAEQVVKEAGLETAVSTVAGIEQSNTNRYFLYRLRPGGRTGQDLLTWLEKSVYKPLSVESTSPKKPV